MNNHLPVITILRGVAATLVCFYHFIYTTTDYFTNKILLSLSSYGKYGVQMFFVISGIVIPISMINGKYNYSSIFKFFAKRMLRIEIPFIVSIILAIIYLNLRNFIPTSSKIDLAPSFSDFILHLGYLVPFFDNAKWINPVYWTLGIEFQYYLFLALLIPLLLSGKFYFRVLFYFITILIGFIFNSSTFFPYYSSLFLCGIAFALYLKELIVLPELLILLSICFCVVLFKLGFITFVVSLLVISIVQFFREIDFKWLVFLGKISFSLYLLHTIIGTAIINYLSHFYKRPYEKIFVVILGYSISVLSAWVFYKFIEEPSKKMADRIKY